MHPFMSFFHNNLVDPLRWPGQKLKFITAVGIKMPLFFGAIGTFAYSLAQGRNATQDFPSFTELRLRAQEDVPDSPLKPPTEQQWKEGLEYRYPRKF